MSHVEKVMQAFARLLSYPDQHTSQAAELLYVVLQAEIPEAADSAMQFGAFLEQHEPSEVEEAFTRTFDVNPSCALEVGWHLFGEEYARGMFLVRMREELRKYALPESTELPDHLAHVLAVVAAMPEDEAEKFVKACVQPAVSKMNEALLETETPYRHVMSGLAAVFDGKWGTGNAPGKQEFLDSPSAQLDPLHAFPVAGIGCDGGCSGTCGEPDVVKLGNQVAVPERPSSSSNAAGEDRS